MKERYSINDLAMMTGLTTRTLRNHLRQGALRGEKIDGAWTFTQEEIERFISDPQIHKGLESHRNAAVFDFLADAFKTANRACVILDYVADDREAEKIADFYCDRVNRGTSDIKFSYGRNRGRSRVILTGGEDQVLDILRQYYRI
ncbi:MAG: helix-turn-helix domain-containing protein [Clostridia bacterium]|nr:helix-turn-helix domain-containing protein [Clostridia bacterium]